MSELDRLYTRPFLSPFSQRAAYDAAVLQSYNTHLERNLAIHEQSLRRLGILPAELKVAIEQFNGKYNANDHRLGHQAERANYSDNNAVRLAWSNLSFGTISGSRAQYVLETAAKLGVPEAIEIMEAKKIALAALNRPAALPAYNAFFNSPYNWDYRSTLPLSRLTVLEELTIVNEAHRAMNTHSGWLNPGEQLIITRAAELGDAKAINFLRNGLGVNFISYWTPPFV